MKATTEITTIAARVAEIARHHLGKDVRVVLFGSWADGTARERSDIDIGVLARGPIDGAIMEEIREEAEDLPTLYTVDLVDLTSVSTTFREIALESARDIS